MNITVKLIILLGALLVFSLSVRGQVTLGSTELPVEGTLLQIKDTEPEAGFITDLTKNITAQKGGLLLPRVKLNNVNSLAPLSSTSDQATIERHTGLIVYNVGGAGALDAGIYYWADNKWNIIRVGHIYTSAWNKVGTMLSAKNNNDDSYLNAKVVINDSGDETKIQPANNNSKLTVYGNDISVQGVRFGHGFGNVGSNIVLGNNALIASNPGEDNLALGFQALSANNFLGKNNAALGVGALSNITTGINNVAIGNQSGSVLVDGNNNILLGQGIQPLSADSEGTINIGNIVYGFMSSNRVGINTNTPQATLDVNGRMRITEGEAISGGKILRIDANGILKKSKIATRKIAFLSSGNDQVIERDQMNSGNYIEVLWDANTIKAEDEILQANSSSISELTVKRGGLYEISGFLNYNPKTTITGTTPPSSPQDWLAGVNVAIQYRPDSNAGTSWTTLMNVTCAYSAAALAQPKVVEVPPMVVKLQANAQIRMVLYRPNSTFGLAHGSTTNKPSITKFAGSKYTKGLKIISL